MRKEVQNFHSNVLQAYDGIMFDSLVHPHNLITETAKQLTFENEHGEEVTATGYFALKELNSIKQKVFINSATINELPIRINDYDELYFKDSARSKSIVCVPTDITPFKIKAEQMWQSNKEFIDIIAPFTHTEPLYWTLSKIVAIMGYVGKVFCGICSNPEFGKSSCYLVLEGLTKKCPTFQPRSIPGILTQITGDGNMIFDDIHAVAAEVKKMMESFVFKVADNDPVYINGAIKSKYTKKKYDVSQQSITFLYNRLQDYKDSGMFWDNIWEGKTALQSRFLCLLFKGELKEEFDKNFDIPGTAEQNKMFYIKIAKHLLWLKEQKLNYSYQRRYTNNHAIKLKGRHLIIYEEIVWGIDLYSSSQEEFDTLVKVFNDSIIDYHNMIQGNTYSYSPTISKSEKNLGEDIEIKEEVVMSDSQRVMEFIDKHKSVAVETLLSELKINESVLETMKKSGDIFEIKSGWVARL